VRDHEFEKKTFGANGYVLWLRIISYIINELPQQSTLTVVNIENIKNGYFPFVDQEQYTGT